jgi:hypothetical protein
MGEGDDGSHTTLFRMMENLAEKLVSALRSANNACISAIPKYHSQSTLVEEWFCWMSCTMRWDERVCGFHAATSKSLKAAED